ncbi:hypothetical protein E3U55_12705 [Filobacillus milosensis]|uniref:Uncharacterized protein n=1 Tax=Filobacillus milosensis TaxID=94137 RepID=A0A4Y8IHE2_9BACI|nr:hypothetical protein [Filobacillus milosensis]TFB15106.1 hypothetical protein E3U55_12705 [Filobacillus milosensis]
MVQFKYYSNRHYDSENKLFTRKISQSRSTNNIEDLWMKLFEYKEKIYLIERVIKQMEEGKEPNNEQLSLEELTKEIKIINRSIEDMQNDITIIKERIKKINLNVIVEELSDLLNEHHKNQEKNIQTYPVQSTNRQNSYQLKPRTSEFRQLQQIISSSNVSNSKKKLLLTINKSI